MLEASNEYDGQHGSLERVRHLAMVLDGPVSRWIRQRAKILESLGILDAGHEWHALDASYISIGTSINEELDHLVVSLVAS